MVDDIFSQAVLRKIKKDNYLKNNLVTTNDEYYSHPTFRVNSLSEYIHLVTTVSSVNDNSIYDETVIFRGMSDSRYDLSPGLARLKKYDPDIEFEMIKQFLTRRPNDFKGLSDFDILAKMQHYGLPTRLLDFTLNPLVALYFACESKASKPGRVLCHSTYIETNSTYVDKISLNAVNSLNKIFDSNYTVDVYYCDEDLSLYKYLAETYIYSHTTVIRPQYWNKRIANQAGLFMVFSNNLYDRFWGVLVHYNELGLKKALQEYSFGIIDEEIIKEVLKNEPLDIYRSLDNGILTDETFNIMYSSYKNSNNNSWNEIKKYFENRFKVSHSIKLLSTTKINNDFCSIIIEPQNKKKILRDLSYVGIGTDYIYPELEYTAKEIKRKFE